MFSDKDLLQIEKRGSDLEVVKQQVKNFESGFPFLQVQGAAILEDGMVQLTEDELTTYVDFFDKQATKNNLLKFVPASGAASRMFKALFAVLNDGKLNEGGKSFFENLPRFAFYDDLINVIGGYGENEKILKGLLTESGLDYGNLPKGLLQFHSYDKKRRTAAEEHLVEGALYANRNGRVKIHFTVSPEHKLRFKKHIEEVKGAYEEKYNVKYSISFSEQKKYTDTIAVDIKNQPFRLEDGSILFRPAGHGALLENLNEQNADVVFIKNIDNVVPDHLKGETIKYKKALAGLLLSYRKRLFNFAKRLEKEEVSTYTLNKALRFVRFEMNNKPPKGCRSWSFEDKLAYARKKVNRPLRVCGMVKNVGEPGGGPFWVKNEDGSTALQVVESAQFNMKSKRQAAIFSTATHFNPVDLIVSTKNHKKENFDLKAFRDMKTGFITGKSMNGKSLKAQELPGLWNGAMADWNTVFVEVPLVTFNPVKTVNDLLRDQHQPKKG